MAKKKGKKVKGSITRHDASGALTLRRGAAAAHRPLVNDSVHIFVDDQNLFWGIVNKELGPGFRMDFGRMLLEAAKTSDGRTRPVASAYIAGVIPDDDSFWDIAESRGFKVMRGYLGSGNRSKQDDAYLITELVTTLFTAEGPSTIVLLAGDADYVPALEKSKSLGWRNEIASIDAGVSVSLDAHVHEFRAISAQRIQLL